MFKRSFLRLLPAVRLLLNACTKIPLPLPTNGTAKQTKAEISVLSEKHEKLDHLSGNIKIILKSPSFIDLNKQGDLKETAHIWFNKKEGKVLEIYKDEMTVLVPYLFEIEVINVQINLNTSRYGTINWICQPCQVFDYFPTIEGRVFFRNQRRSNRWHFSTAGRDEF